MSTYWSFICLGHEPPLWSDAEFTQHTNDAPYRHALELAASRPVERASETADYFDRNARDFLVCHPTCPLAIESEYGERLTLP